MGSKILAIDFLSGEEGEGIGGLLLEVKERERGDVREQKFGEPPS